jgi:tetraprenyl-beta-curcumene synthase
MGTTAWRRVRLAVAFANAAVRYWLTVFPLVRWEAHRWRECAAAIPDPGLRQIALDTQRGERGNLEGAAAFAAFVPLRRRAAVVQAVVAFQATYDYVDSLAEQPSAAPEANARALHAALRVALCPSARHDAYYRHQAQDDDGGYLRQLVDACRSALQTLPALPTIAPHVACAVERMVEYQALIHSPADVTSQLATWARSERPRGSPLTWWEIAAAGASSLVVFALVAAAARRKLSSIDAAALACAYFPWIGALHVLLDSLVDQRHDEEIGHYSLVSHYASPQETAARLGSIATTAFALAGSLEQGRHHTLLLAAMSAFYLAAPERQVPHAGAARARILGAFGDLASPMIGALRFRARLDVVGHRTRCFRN